ncbi:hypothetical protein HYDPIDRAFT_184303 [Hydnomerulius pinastri MD-312]|nr:hypothetical protein HYDPIDRAFT_184303 [Hydnomerulius pinastri MD-312]
MSTVTTLSLHAAATSQNVTLPPIPELFNPDFLDLLIPATQSIPEPKMEMAPEASNAMMDALRNTTHQKLTANGAPAFNTTRIPTLDAFLGLRTGIKGEAVDRFLENAWAEDPDLTLRIIWHTRSIHDGKSEKEFFYRAFGWLYENHPRTAIANVRCLVDPMCSRISGEGATKKRQSTPHGYWKDLLNILALATVDELYPKRPLKPRSNFLHNYYDGKSRPAFKNNEEQEEWSRAQRVERHAYAHARLSRKLLDKHYLALYVAVARLFADRLTKDYDVLTKIAALPGNANRKDRLKLMFALTFAPKWAPTPGGSHDRVTNIASAICLLLHHAQVSSSFAPKINLSPSEPLPALDMHLLRCFYQRHVLTPGRRHTCTPEPLMSANRWSEIVYQRVPSLCMKSNKEKFFAHDTDRFLSYLTDVEKGKSTISGATLLPHQLVMEAVELARSLSRSTPTFDGKPASIAAALQQSKRRLAETQIRVVEAQWATLLARLRESGRLDNCIAVCDVSGSMGTVWDTARSKSPFDVYPIWPAISLSLVLARLAKPPFADSFITFSATPELVVLDPESKHVSLGNTVDTMAGASWGMNTDFNAVFLDLILPLAVKHKIPKDQMIKRIFVFSDMQFDAAAGSPGSGTATWETNHDIIERAYQDAGYDVPEIVYWDLSSPHGRGSITAPVTGEREGVALLSGFSPSLLKVFMDEEEDWEVLDKVTSPMTPEEIMKKAVGRRSFDGATSHLTHKMNPPLPVPLLVVLRYGCRRYLSTIPKDKDKIDLPFGLHATLELAACTPPTAFRRPTLGHAVFLGELYDERQGEFLGVQLYEQSKIESATKSTNIKFTDLKVTKSNTFGDKAGVVDISGELSLSVVCGLVRAQGSAAYLSDSQCNTKERSWAMNLKMRLREQRLLFMEDDLALNVLDLAKREYIATNRATHFVSSITFGGNVVVNLVARSSKLTEEWKTEGALDAEINKLRGMVDLREKVLDSNMKNKFTELNDKFDVSVYGDVALERVPVNPQDVLEFLPSAAKLIGDGVPISVTLQPIPAELQKSALFIHHLQRAVLDSLLEAFGNLDDVKSRFVVLEEGARIYGEFIPRWVSSVRKVFLAFQIRHRGLLDELAQFVSGFRQGSNSDIGSALVTEAQSLYDAHDDAFYSTQVPTYPTNLAGLERTLADFTHFFNSLESIGQHLSSIQDVSMAANKGDIIPLVLVPPLRSPPDAIVIQACNLVRIRAAGYVPGTLRILYAESPVELEARLCSDGKFSILTAPTLYVGQVVKGSLTWAEEKLEADYSPNIHHICDVGWIGTSPRLYVKLDNVDGTKSFSIVVQATRRPDRSEVLESARRSPERSFKFAANFVALQIADRCIPKSDHLNKCFLRVMDKEHQDVFYLDLYPLYPELNEPFTATCVQDVSTMKRYIYLQDEKIYEQSFQSVDPNWEQLQLFFGEPSLGSEWKWWIGEVHSVKAYARALTSDDIGELARVGTPGLSQESCQPAHTEWGRTKLGRERSDSTRPETARLSHGC